MTEERKESSGRGISLCQGQKHAREYLIAPRTTVL